MPKATPRAQRLQDLETALRTKSWTMKLEGELSKKWSVSRETVRRDFALLKCALAERSSGAPLEERRALLTSRLEEQIEAASTQGKSNHAIMGLKILATLQGLDVPPPREEQEESQEEPTDALVALALRLRSTRRLRRSAERDGSYVAAQSLLKLEAEIIGQIESEKRSRAAALQGTASDEELVATLAAGLASLPPALREQVLAQVRG